MSAVCIVNITSFEHAIIKGVHSAKSYRSVRGLEKGVSGKSYSRLCNARILRFEPGTFRSQMVGQPK